MLTVCRKRRDPLSSQSMISAFTPINSAILNITPTLPAPSQTPIRARKRSAGQPETPPPTSKRPRIISKPRQLRQPKQPKEKLGSGDQDISTGLIRTNEGSTEDGMPLYKAVHNDSNDRQLIEEQASVISAELSTATLCKLNAFSYRTGADKGPGKLYQALPRKTQFRGDDHGIDHIRDQRRTELAMRPTFTRPTSAIDTNLIANIGSIAPPTTPTRQAAEELELLRAATDFHTASRQLGQAFGESGSFDGYVDEYDQTPLPPVGAWSSLKELPQTSSPDVQETALPSSVCWDEGGEGQGLLDMFTKHSDLKSIPNTGGSTLHRTLCDNVSIELRSMPQSDIPDTLTTSLVAQQETGAADDEFPVEDEELCNMMQLPVDQELLMPASSGQCSLDPSTQRNEYCDTISAYLGADSGKAVRSSHQEDEYIPTSAQIIAEPMSSPPNHRQEPHLTDLNAIRHLGRGDDNQMNSGQQSDDLEDLNQHADSDFPGPAEAVLDDEYEAVSPPARPLSPQLTSDMAPAQIPALGSSCFPPVNSATPEVRPSSVTSPSVAQPRSPQANVPIPSHVLDFNADGSPKPFVRPKFPTSIRDRSPILGLSPRISHRTCFRIGEALNAASAASRATNEVLIELYARVISSSREEGRLKQHFEFADLFSSRKPPFLSGTYDLWKGVPLWETDSRSFLGEDGKGRLARVIGKITRDEGSSTCRMRILNLWPATLVDVAWVKGIVCA
ncbi:MAG: hypothetical protein LQ347_003499 [Umbilicaria vellea]|nr:MAG: hypothetical protein LQ347_003499 [Umbilicaria vellea]